MAPSENTENAANDNSKSQCTTCEVNGEPFVMENEPRRERCVGRCDMELGDITHHNVEVIINLDSSPGLLLIHCCSVGLLLTYYLDFLYLAAESDEIIFGARFHLQDYLILLVQNGFIINVLFILKSR